MKHKNRIINLFLTAALLVTVFLGCPNALHRLLVSLQSASREESSAKEVHFAIQPSAAFIPLYVAKEEGWMEEALAEYGVTVHWHNFNSGPPINASMLKEESDIGVLGDVPTVFAIGVGQENVIIATAAQAADSYAVLVPADSAVTSAGQLKGKRVATVIGTTAHNLMSKYLASAGLSMKDVNFVNINASDAMNVLLKDRADAVTIWEPSVTRIADAGAGRILGEGSDCGLAGTNTLVARADFAEKNPELVEVILEQYRRGAKALKDGLSEETLQKIADYMSLDSEQILALLPKFQYTVDISQEDIDSLNDTINFLFDVKQLPTRYDISEYVYQSPD